MSETTKEPYSIAHWEADEYIVLGPNGPVGGTGHKGQMEREARIRNEAHFAATPPTPDLDAQAERLWANALHGDRDEWLAEVRALLAAVSRPAEAHWQTYLRETGQHIATPQAAPEVTSDMMDEMIERGMQAWENTLSDRDVSRAEVVAAILTAALRAAATGGRDA